MSDLRHREALKNLGFTCILVRRTNMGMVSPGHIESAFKHQSDADRECEHLCKLYAAAFRNGEGFPAFEVETL